MSNANCKGCAYSSTLTSYGVICDYIGVMGHSRPCLPNKDCTVRSLGPKSKPGKKRRWDTAKAEVMRAEGKADHAIAAQLGTTVAAIRGYFNQKRMAVKQ